jgi:hypothetical protein
MLVENPEIPVDEQEEVIVEDWPNVVVRVVFPLLILVVVGGACIRGVTVIRKKKQN